MAPEATIAQRIVRAKKTIAEAGVPFEVPTGADRATRLESVLQVIYLIYNEGYSATSGEDWLRPELCAEALRVGRVLAALAPEEPEVFGLLALMEFQSSRLRARTAPSGTPVLLLDQDRRTWDRLHITRGEDALARAEQLGEPRGPYTLQAAIAASHARAFRPEDTDWDNVVRLYGELARATPSPIVELNRAVAISMASGPGAALQLVDQLVETGTLERYHLLSSVRGDLLHRLGRHDEAALEFDRAAALATNAQERTLSEERARGEPRPGRGSAVVRCHGSPAGPEFGRPPPLRPPGPQLQARRGQRSVHEHGATARQAAESFGRQKTTGCGRRRRGATARRITRHRGMGGLFVPDEPAGVVEGVGVRDAGQEQLGPVIVEHGRRPGPVPAPDLRQVLPHRDDLDPVRRTGGGEPVELGQRSDMRRLVQYDEERGIERPARLRGARERMGQHGLGQRGEVAA